jgi:hypothetical protein
VEEMGFALAFLVRSGLGVVCDGHRPTLQQMDRLMMKDDVMGGLVS